MPSQSGLGHAVLRGEGAGIELFHHRDKWQLMFAERYNVHWVAMGGAGLAFPVDDRPANSRALGVEEEVSLNHDAELPFPVTTAIE
jgi:hypothetical protein